MRKLGIILLVALLSFSSALADIEVVFLDVGQADAAVVVCDDQVLMIDGGNVDDSQFIPCIIVDALRYLNSLIQD